MTRPTPSPGRALLLCGLGLILCGCPPAGNVAPDVSIQQDTFRPNPGDDGGVTEKCRGLLEDPETGECVRCLEDTDCHAEGPSLVCHPTARECVGCVEDNDCDHGFCLPGKSYCAQCFADEHCSSGRCDEEALVCVGCGADADCDDDNPCTIGHCDDQLCQYEPADGQPCDGDPCIANDVCQGGKCIIGDVVEAACTVCNDPDDCESGYCRREAGQCGGQGHCDARPRDCTDEIERVCGCLGTTYSNPCRAALEGESVDKAGRCPCAVDKDCGDSSQFICQVGDAKCPNADGTVPTIEKIYECVPVALGCDDSSGKVCVCGGAEDFDNKCLAWNAGYTEWEDDCCLDCVVECKHNESCDNGLFCKKSGCGDVPGVCEPLPNADDQPVCGCDQKTYPDATAAAKQGVTVHSLGACECPVIECLNDTIPVDTTGDSCSDACQCGLAGPENLVQSQCPTGELCAEKTASSCDNTVKICVPAVLETGEMCGCDGKTYENAKAVHAANMAIKYAGVCD